MTIFENLKQFADIEFQEGLLDNFQNDILSNLYLEFCSGDSHTLVTPDMSILNIGETQFDFETQVTNFVSENAALLDKFRRYLLHNLIIHSAILENNSLYITVNGNLIIARLSPSSTGKAQEIVTKIYTINGSELVEYYKDKIYIGSDLISLAVINGKYFSIDNFFNLFKTQFQQLIEYYQQHLDAKQYAHVHQEYLEEIHTLSHEISSGIAQIKKKERQLYGNDLKVFDQEGFSKDKKLSYLLEINPLFRDVKHLLLEALTTINELEDYFYDQECHNLVGYVIKIGKDIENAIHYIMTKINGRISDAINSTYYSV